MCSNDSSTYESIIVDSMDESARLLCFKFNELTSLRVSLSHYLVSAAIFDLNTSNETILETIGQVQKAGTNCKMICVTGRKVLGNAVNHNNGTFAYVHSPLRASTLRRQLLRTPAAETLPFQGPCHGRSLLEIIQLLLFSGLSGKLIVWSAFMRGELWVHRSQLVHAEFGGMVGQPALQAMRELPRGTFRFQKGRAPLQTLQLGVYHPMLSLTGQSVDDLAGPADSGDSLDGAEDDEAVARDASGMSSGGSQYSPPQAESSTFSSDSRESPPAHSSPHPPPSARTIDPMEVQALEQASDASTDDLASGRGFSWPPVLVDETSQQLGDVPTASEQSRQSPPASAAASTASSTGNSDAVEAQPPEDAKSGLLFELAAGVDFSWLPVSDSEPLPQAVEPAVKSSFSQEWPSVAPSHTSAGETQDALTPVTVDDVFENFQSPAIVQSTNEQSPEQRSEYLWQQLCASEVPTYQMQENTMAVTSNTVKEILARLELNVEGFIGAAVADSDSGMCLGSLGGAGILNVEVAAAGNTEVVRSKRKAMKALNIRDEIEDILITLAKQYHLIRPLRARPVVFIYLAVDRARANLAMARYALGEAERDLGA